MCCAQLLCMSDSLQPDRLLGPWNLPGKNCGAGCHVLLRGAEPTPLVSPPLAGGLFTRSTTWEAQVQSKTDQKAHQKENYHIPPSAHSPACLTLHIPHQSRAFVTTNQRTLTHHYDSNSNIYIRVHS